MATTRSLVALIAVASMTLAAGSFLGGCDRGPYASDVPATAAPQPAAALPAAGERPAAEAPQADEARLKITYPQEGTLFPPEIVAPTFLWEDAAPGAARWSVIVRTDGVGSELRFTSDTPRWRPSEDTWSEIKQRSLERDAEVTVERGNHAAASFDRSGVPPNEPSRRPPPPAEAVISASVHIRTSKDPVGDSLFYREVPLPFLTAVQDPSRIRWRFGTIDSEQGPPIVLQNLPVCGNCHSFADNGSVLGLDVDYGNDKGAYAIIPTAKKMVMSDDKIITWAEFKRADGELTFGLMSRVSPTGRYVISTVKDRSVFVAVPEITFSQLFFPIKGLLVVYDRETGKFEALPGADDPQYVQTNAVWSPDGKTIVFARSEAYRAAFIEQKNAVLIDEKDVPEFTRDHKPFRYDLYRIPFNDGKGGKAEPIEGASGDGRSNFFPKFSPDGKWIVFCKAASYMLLQPDSELYIVPAAGGVARRLRYNTARMNSWHSWSSNSRWLVFSSKVNTPYTQLFLTHIDEDGSDSPPVLLERFTSPDRAANIPEFVKLPGDAITEIREQFLDPYSFLRAGITNENTGDHKGAERLFRRGLELDPKSAELHNALGWTLFQEGRTAEAVAEYQRAIANEPKHVKSHNNLALALVELGRLDEAATHFRRSLELEPKAEIYSDLGFVAARLGRPDEALANYRKALELDPHCASAHFNLAVASVMAGKYGDAEPHYREALAAKPNAETYNGLGYVLAHQGRLDEAVVQFRKAIETDPKYTPAFNNLAGTLEKQGKLDEAETYYRRSLDEKQSAAVYNDLGAVLVKLGKIDDAAKQFRNALAMDAGNAEAKRSLAAIERTGGSKNK